MESGMAQPSFDDSEAKFAEGFHENAFTTFEDLGAAEVERRLTAGTPPFHQHNVERVAAAVWLCKKGM
jgi:hypothetical protein